MHSFTELPFEVIQHIASFLLPYDLLTLTITCHTLISTLFEKTIWMQVAERVSRSRPLPFTAVQARDLPIEALIESCLRAERVAKRWAEPDIYPSAPPVKITFPDNRIVTYFTFLPGSRHLMVYDIHNFISCWTTSGRLLEMRPVVGPGARLARWKPCDESESSYDFLDTHDQAVEIMVEYSSDTRPTRCELVLLVYSETHARFESVSNFTIPSFYEPFSALTQDELCGSLVRIDTIPERVGIYLTNKNSERCVCIDTGLTLVIDCIPQALLSKSQLVLYWETLSSAHTYTYEMDTLRSVLESQGGPQDVHWPVRVPPSDVSAIPFRTVSVSGADRNTSSCGTCVGCGARVEQALPSTDLSGNHDAYPVIIPKWHTLREDLRRHRTRSILTFSRRPSNILQAQANALAIYVNAPDADVMHMHEVDHGGGATLNGNNTHAADDGEDLLDAENERHLAHHVGHYVRRSLPQTTITHHYFDYLPSSSGNAPRELVRTVLAEAPLRRPHGLHMHHHLHHAHAVVMEEGGEEGGDNDVEVEGTDVQHFGGYDFDDFDDDNQEDENGYGLQLEGVGVVDFGNEPTVEYDGEEDDLLQAEGNQFFDHDWHEQENNNNDAPADAGANDYGDADIEALQHDLEGLGLELDDGEAPMQMHQGDILSLTPEAVQALSDVLQDPFGGGQVMGYGGRCAMWVEEHPRKHRANGRAPVLRIATFPSYEPRDDGKDSGAIVHPELDVAAGRVGTLHLPRNITLETAYTFDLSDVRGLVGIATLLGELWIVDFS